MRKRNSKYWNCGIGSVFPRKTKKGFTRWYMQFKDEDGRWKQKVIKYAQTKEEAQFELYKRNQEIFYRKNGIKPKPKRIKFSEFAEMYLEDYAKSNKRSWETDRSCLKFMREYFGEFYLEEISPQNIEQYKKQRLESSGVTKSTVNYDLAILRKMLNLAIEWGYLEESQNPKIKFYSVKDNLKERILTQEEEESLLNSSSEHLKPILIVALNTGMRRGEILNLKWNQIDFNTRRIRVEKTKSGKIRFIDINKPLMDELILLKKKQRSEYVFFNRETGKPYQDVSRTFTTTCRRAGIKNLRFHDLRHYAEFRTMPSRITRAIKLLGNKRVVVLVGELYSA